MPLIEAVTTVDACVWGFVGGAILESLEFSAAIRRVRGWPWQQKDEPSFTPLFASVVLRLGAGAGLAAGAAASGQIAGVFSALVLGITAPLVVERIIAHATGGPRTHHVMATYNGAVDVGLSIPADRKPLDQGVNAPEADRSDAN
jgi:hypothetical protein